MIDIPEVIDKVIDGTVEHTDFVVVILILNLME